MKTIKVSEATNIQLNWLVAKCQSFDADAYEIKRKAQRRAYEAAPVWSPTTNWSQMGPIMEREKITMQFEQLDTGPAWSAYKREFLFEGDGSDCWSTDPTPLVATARCYVTSKMGEEVEVPKELT